MHGWMEDRVCLITDGCSAAGKELAVSLAKMDATVVIVGAGPRQTAAAESEIRQRSGSRRVEGIVSDLASRDEVYEVASDFLCEHDRLDVLVNNAELVPTERALTVDGYESSLAVNHLAPFLLTRVLLEQLPSIDGLRIVNVTHGEHAPRLQVDDLNGDHRFHPGSACAATRLMNVLFTYELARRLDGTGATVNCVRPAAALPWLSSPRTRALGPLFLATSVALEGVSGKYFVKMKQARSATASYDLKLQQRLWSLTAQLVGQRAAPRSSSPTPRSAERAVALHRRAAAQ